MRIASATLILLLASPALAEDTTGASGTPGTHVEMPYLMAPMTTDGQLSGYAYISSKVVASTPMAALDIRGRIAYIQDAFVRDVNGAGLAQKGNPPTVDNAALSARLLSDAQRIMGGGKVVGVEIIQVQVSPLRSDKAPVPPS
ncbi:MAG TPA: hypothetical protein VGU69_06320 [Rhizomicrobium sp.]|nr:hypothetical protein [Rhizomicrobium sp.]